MTGGDEHGRPLGDPSPTRTVHALPTTRIWAARWRHRVARPVGDALGQGVASLTLAMVAITVGRVFAQTADQRWAAVAMGVAMASLGFFALLVARSVKREKTIQYWRDRRELRLKLRRARAHEELLVDSLRRMHELDDRRADVPAVLEQLADHVHKVLGADHEEVAVLLGLESQGHWRLSHVATQPGSCWDAEWLRAGVRNGRQPLRDALSELARRRDGFDACTASGAVRIGILSSTPFSEDDRVLLEQLQLCLDMIAARRPHRPATASRELHSVG